jgi:hypothetical protein
VAANGGVEAANGAIGDPVITEDDCLDRGWPALPWLIEPDLIGRVDCATRPGVFSPDGKLLPFGVSSIALLLIPAALFSDVMVSS